MPNLMATVENLTVSVHPLAKVVINERTGTIVMGQTVTLGAARCCMETCRLSLRRNSRSRSPRRFQAARRRWCLRRRFALPKVRPDVSSCAKGQVSMISSMGCKRLVRRHATLWEFLKRFARRSSPGAIGSHLMNLSLHTHDFVGPRLPIRRRDSGSSNPRKVRKAAEEFEGMLIAQMLGNSICR